MWFRFPDGTTAISVNQQHFVAEVENEHGSFFRAPNHFAPMILDLKGFKTAIPDTDLPDLAEANPKEDSIVAQMAAKIDGLMEENERLKGLVKIAHENLKIEQEKTKDLETKIGKLEAMPTAASPNAGTKK